MNAEHCELLKVEQALEQWRTDRGWYAVGCGHAERVAFDAGWEYCLRSLEAAGVDFNAVRTLDADEETVALRTFRAFW